MTNKDKVLKIFPDAFQAIHYWGVDIWCGRGYTMLVICKRETRMKDQDREREIEKAWKYAWNNVQKLLIKKLEK